ncbi:hypothetical protein TrLO_g2207 [Triparma laevis f. longispina]|uniref:Uncharacterized protein n=1 Tax=Triparma laevis f. longispina TaxID=1714387 RepID=A0A9W6ZZP6_9STRA|nr:hypothetical protein TrLO_g2207 [Triparma laevis f. longispina]
MDAYESDSDSGGRGGIPQSSILKQISAIQNISHEMSEPTRRSAESSFVSNVSWQQPGVRVTGGGREKLRPENVRSGTRIAHKIAKASIQELLLARSAMDLEENSTSLLLDTSTSETIFNKIMSFNKENSPTSKQPNDSDDHLETESIISMLSDTTNGTRTLAFSNLKSRLALLDRDDLGLDEISVDIDGGDNDSDSDDALSLANSISKEMGCTSLSRPAKAPSKINLQIIEPTPPPSTSYIKLTINSSSPLRYYFLKLVQSSINLKTLRINLKFWYCYTKSMCKSRNLGYNCLIFYKRFFIKECFKGLKYYGMLRKWDEKILKKNGLKLSDLINGEL